MKYIKINRNYNNNNQNEMGIIKDEGPSNYEVLFYNGNQEDVPKSICSIIDPSKTGDNFDFKICNVCGRCLPVEDFSINQNGKDNRIVRRPTCKECRINIDGKKISATDRKKWNKLKPDKERWTCPICHKTSIPGITSHVVLDHNHETGKPRDWICDSCNTGLGRFKDDVNILQRAIKYLKDRDNLNV